MKKQKNAGVDAAKGEAECTDQVCITCSDEGREAQVVAIGDHGRADVLAGGQLETVDASLVDARPGDVVLVHAGVALALVDQSQGPAYVAAMAGRATPHRSKASPGGNAQSVTSAAGRTGAPEREVPQREAPALGATAGEAAVFGRIEAFRRRRPRLLDEVVTLAHGAGGKASAALLEAVFLPALAGDDPGPLTDAAVLELPSGERLALSTDSFVVKPLRFPGGSAGRLAVHGTVNDLAMMGARPLALSAAFVIEEGFAIDTLRDVVADMGEAAAGAGVSIVTGDTKVVDHGAADGLYITTAGIGSIPEGRSLSVQKVHQGDVVILSGTMADHGTAVMLARGDLMLEADISSDTAPLYDLMETLMAAAPSTRWLRDATRGGVGTVCNELARDCNLTVVLDEVALPVRPAVAAACELLGIDPLYVANEGKFVAVVAPQEELAALAALRSHPLGAQAVRIGDIRAEPPGVVVLATQLGGARIVDMLVGDPLPRIC
jgi:hydrogenase expression/formation protein HypE